MFLSFIAPAAFRTLVFLSGFSLAPRAFASFKDRSVTFSPAVAVPFLLLKFIEFIEGFAVFAASAAFPRYARSVEPFTASLLFKRETAPTAQSPILSFKSLKIRRIAAPAAVFAVAVVGRATPAMPLIADPIVRYGIHRRENARPSEIPALGPEGSPASSARFSALEIAISAFADADRFPAFAIGGGARLVRQTIASSGGVLEMVALPFGALAAAIALSLAAFSGFLAVDGAPASPASRAFILAQAARIVSTRVSVAARHSFAGVGRVFVPVALLLRF